MQSNTYIALLVSICGPYVLAVAYFAFAHSQPLVGDLTRLRGMSEEQFGWNQAQKGYNESHNFVVTHDLADYNKPYDIVVAGDSFSFLENTSWVNTLVEQTGLNAIVLHLNHVPINDLLQHPLLHQSPPKYFVLESVNRRLYERLEVLEVPEQTLGPRNEISTSEPTVFEKREFFREVRFQGMEDRLAQAIHLVSVRSKCFVDESSCKVAVLKTKPDAPKLFSSNSRNELALLRGAYRSRTHWDRRSPEAIRRLKQLTNYFEAAPDTEFMLLIYPDRLSLYADYIDAPYLENAQLIPEIAKIMSIPRLDIAFQQLMVEGVVDVFLPNDSHTGGYANSVAGRVAVDHLLKVSKNVKIAQSH